MCCRVPPCPPAPQGAPYVDVTYRSYPGKASTSSTQENSATHHHYHQHSHPHQRLSTSPESSPVWADAKHTCCGTAGCRPYSGDFTATDGEAGKQDSSRESRPPRALHSTTHADLINSHVSSLLWPWLIIIIIISINSISDC